MSKSVVLDSVGGSFLMLSFCLLVACSGGGSSSNASMPGPPAQSDPLPSVDVSTVAAADPGSSLPPQWMFGGFMEIYVRGYQDSNGDGVGDLKGLIQRLDYLKDLGVAGLWLMPVTRSQDNDHGYAVSDYRNIEAQYGSLADLDELVKQAHARGIGVIIDYVMNHSGSLHPAFVNSRAAATNAFRDWYLWQSVKPTGWSIYNNDPWRNGGTGYYFAGFSEQMPDFNLLNPAVVGWHQDNLRFWLNRGVDGFRFDAVGNLVENGPAAWEGQPQDHVIMHSVRTLLDTYARRYMVCEGPVDPLGYASANSCGSAFAFGHNNNLIKAAKGDATAIRAVADYHLSAPPTIATMLSNHDSFAGDRVWDQVSGNIAQYKLAAATYLLQPGIPFIYYGEEIGMSGGANLSGDARLRTPMSWTADTTRAGFTTGIPFRALSANVATNNAAAQQSDAASIHAFYKAMLGLRKARPSLARGSYEGAAVAGNILSFRRLLDGEQTLVALNYGGAPATLAATGLTAGATYNALWPAGFAPVTADASGNASFELPAQGIVVFGR